MSSRPLMLVAAVLASLAAAPARAWYDPGPEAARPGAAGVHVTDGSAVMDAGQLQVNVTNWGLIGSRYSLLTSYADAPSAQWPAGSGVEHLFGAGLWIGALLRNEPRVSTGQPQAELRPLPDLASTVYEAYQGDVRRPAGYPPGGGNRRPSSRADDDGDGRVDEDPLDGRDNDGDGRIDEDWAQIGDQMMVCRMYDNTLLAREIYPDHQPLDVEVTQSSYVWQSPEHDDFVAFSFQVRNVGPVDLEDVYVGLYVDADIGRRGRGDTGEDDLAGFWEGGARAGDGQYMTVSVAYMHDGARRDPVPSYFGVMPLGRTIATFRVFSARQPYEMGGEPTEDAQRYEVLSSGARDPDTPPTAPADYRFLISLGPLSQLRSGGSAVFDLALVAGGSLDEMLGNCANAAQAWWGEFFDFDGDPTTGIGGRETLTCEDWWPINPQSQRSSLFDMYADHMDESCLSWDMPLHTIEIKDMFVDPRLNLRCIWVNMDNCAECERQAGQPCTPRNHLMATTWNCNRRFLPAGARRGCTGILGRELQLPWFVTRGAPPSPAARTWAERGAVHLFWDDRSEHVPDRALDEIDFESYVVWRADDWSRPHGTSLASGPPTDLWHVIDEYDLDDTYLQIRLVGRDLVVRELPLGRNTGLEVAAYRPRCLDDRTFAGLAEAMAAVVAADTAGRFPTRPALRAPDGSPLPGLQALLPWEGWPAVLDTFFAVASRPADPEAGDPGKRPVRFYEHVDRQVHDGLLYFYAVTASDHALSYDLGTPFISGPGLVGSPGASFVTARPGHRAQTAAERRARGPDIYVYPNPATRAALARFQPLTPDASDPTGVRVMFANLPRARNRVRIFTLDGDLVADLPHDGTTGDGQLPWNLVSRNGQQVASGIYLYEVDSDDDRFEPFVGKFVVVR